MDSIVASWFADPDHVKLRAKQRDTTPADLHGSAEYSRVNRATNGMLRHRHTVGLELGYDAMQIFNHVQHSTSVVLIRSAQDSWSEQTLCIDSA